MLPMLVYCVVGSTVFNIAFYRLSTENMLPLAVMTTEETVLVEAA